MGKQKKGSVGPAPKNKNDINSDLTGNGTYEGQIEGIVGLHRLLIKGKCDYVYVRPARLEAKKAKYGKDFIRDLGPVKSDPRPVQKASSVTYLV